MKKPVVAVAWYSTMKHDVYQMARSFKYYHPDIPLVIYGTDFVQDIINRFGPQSSYAPIMDTLTDKYDLVIHLDADCLITSRLEEILEGDFDVAGVKNNSYLGTAGAVNPGYSLRHISIDKYINIGSFAVKGEKGAQFIKQWVADALPPSFGEMPFFEQGTFNLLFHSGNYNAKLLDEDENPYYYGVSTAWGNRTHWDSWKQIRLENDQLYLRHKLIRMLHKAGAGSPDHRFNFDQLFSPPVADFMRKITDENIKVELENVN